MTMHPGALKLVASRLADTLRPRPPMRVSDWLAENLVLVDGNRAGQLWSPAGAPYLVEIADCLSEAHPSTLVTVRKSQQTGASILALGWVLYCADREPANMLYAAPNISLLRDLNSAKLQPLIDAWHKRQARRIIAPTVSRSASSSTTYEKVFTRGGRLFLGNANSVEDLSSKTVKKGIKDELSKWAPIPGAQDPEDLFFGRFTAFRASDDWKILEISTPEYDSGDPLGEKPGHCRIDRSFKRSDQRFWHIACPECQHLQVQVFEQLRVDEAHPHRSRYLCENCGHEISEAERRAQVMPEAGARWIATQPGPDRHPGFHIDGFCSLMMSYGAIAEDWLKARGGGEIGLKGFHNLTLGLPFQYRGDAPDHEKLLARREEHLQRGHVPADALIVTASADVQMRGIWLEIVGWTADRRSYLIDAAYLGGDTDSPGAPVFERLRAMTLDRDLIDAWGRPRRIDALGVDAGYRQHIVAQWVRSNQTLHPDMGRDMVFALKGEDGWSRPPLGLPKLVDIDLDGHKVRQGCRLWPVGTWPLKASVYSALGRERIASSFDEVPAGYCHLPAWADAEYVQQLTAERLVDTVHRGVATGKRWEKMRADNHFLDCRVGNLALAEHLGLSDMTADEWASLKARRTPPADDAVPLFSARATPETAPPAPRAVPPSDDWLGGRADNW